MTPGERWLQIRNKLYDDFNYGNEMPAHRLSNLTASWAAYIVALEERADRLPRDAIKLVCRCGKSYDPVGDHAVTCPAFDLSPLFVEPARIYAIPTGPKDAA